MTDPAGRRGDRVDVRIEARQPLLRAGLERIARAADLRVVDGGPAHFVLRGAEPVAGGPDLDVAVTGEVCVVTCHRSPDAEVWDAVHRVIAAAAG